MDIPSVDAAYLIDFLTGLLNTPSPTGYSEAAIAYIESDLDSYPGLTFAHTRKGGLVVQWEGQRDDHPRALTAHADTLGAIVKQVKPNGRLKLSKLGGYAWNTVESEGCTIFTQGGKNYRGVLLINKASGHVHGKDTAETKREDEFMEVRVDARTTSPEETLELGIQVGDFVAFDPRVEINNGFIRSRHLDDKACVASLVTAVKAMNDAKLKPLQTTTLLFSNFEEVGHGASAGIPASVEELLVVDMAAVGEGQTSDEFSVSICVKDSSGPYHHGLSTRLRDLADQYEIPYKVDIYPYYGSDGGAFLRAGGDVQVALIGPGVDASHNYERTHSEALVATTKWVLAYLLN